MLFLFADNRCADKSSATDKQQCDPQHEVACVAGFGGLRQLSRYGVGLGDLLGAVFASVILIAAAAVPILGVALGVLGRRPCVIVLKVGVVVRVELAVGFAAVFAYRLFGAGRCAAGAILCFNAVAAVHRAFAGVCAVAVRLPFAESMPVVYRHGHLGGVARPVDNDYLLLGVCRREGTLSVCEAIVAAYKGSIHTILTSGTIMVLITAVIGPLFGNPTIEQIIRTLSVGCASAMFLILFVLSGILALCDRVIVRKTKG